MGTDSRDIENLAVTKGEGGRDKFLRVLGFRQSLSHV